MPGRAGGRAARQRVVQRPAGAHRADRVGGVTEQARQRQRGGRCGSGHRPSLGPAAPERLARRGARRASAMRYAPDPDAREQPHGRRETHPDLSQRGRPRPPAGVGPHPLPAGRRATAATTPTTTSPTSSRTASSTSCAPRSRRRCRSVLRALVIDTESDHNTNDTAKRVAKMFLTEVFRGRYVAAAVGHRVPERLAPQRADDRRPDHGAQRLLAPPLPDPRQGLDRPAAERALEPDRPVEVRRASATGS